MQKLIKLFFLLIFVHNVQDVICQSTNVFNATYKYISPENERYITEKKFKFEGLSIIDARPDTSKIGLYVPKISFLKEREIRRLNYTNGFTKDVKSFLWNYYKLAFTETGDSILLVIRKAWVSQYDTTLSLGNNLVGSGRIFLTKLKLEIYLKNKEYYYPVNRFDTSFITTPKRSVSDFGYEITDAIINCLDNLFNLNTASVLQRKKYTLAQIDQFNARDFDHPILHTNKYKKGMYVTFQEFLNNEPSLDYTGINQTKYGDVLYLNNGSGKEYASNRFWGYSDGENLYIISAKNFFRLNRIQNTFEFYGIKNLRERFDNFSDVPKKRKPALDMCIYQVDMDTGETY